MTTPLAAIEPNLEIAGAFLSALDPSGQFTFQTFADAPSERGNLARLFHGTLDQHFEALRELNGAGAGVFVTVNRTDLKGRKAGNIVAVRGIFADFDHGTNAAKNFPLRPNIAVTSSPQRYHAYWLANDIPTAAFTGLQKALIQRVNSDPSVNDLPRVMRLPGFLHRKSEPYLVTCKVLESKQRTLAEINRALHSATPPTSKATPPTPVTDLHKLKAEALASSAATRSIESPTTGRHKLAVILGWDCRKANVPEEVALNAAVTFAQRARKTDSNGNEKPLVDAEVVSAVQNAYGAGKRPDAVPHGDLAPISAIDLLQRTYAPVRWIVPGILPAGLTLLAGKPKTGKSWLAYDIAYAVATGTPSLTPAPARPGEVLYLALEDNERRLQQRLKALRQDRDDASSPARLYLQTQCPRLDQGAIEHIRKWLQAHPESALVIVDTLAKLRAQRGKNSDCYGDDYAASSALKQLADDFSISVLVVTHNRKADSEDPMDLISGTLGLSGGADGVLIMRRKRGDKNATLFVIGRDIEEEKDYGIEFRGCRWHVVGDARSIQLSVERQSVVDFLKKANQPMTIAKITAGTGGNNNATRKLIYRMHQAGDLTQEKDRKHYSLPSCPTSPNNDTSPTCPTSPTGPTVPTTARTPTP